MENIIYEKIELVGVLQVNRPKALNALNVQTIIDFEKALDKIEQDRELRCLVITGSGDKAFVAGADIVEMSKMTSIQAKEFSQKGQGIFRRLEILRIPVIAAVNGYALGGGCELACACDFIYASEKAKFGQPEVALGLMPGFGGTQRLARFVGLANARELIYTGRQINAQEALRIGLVNKVCEPEKLMNEVLECAKIISKQAPLAVAASKEAINDGFDVAIDKGLGFEVDLFSDLFESEDVKIGTKAFIEKTPAKFIGE
ncbi:MAG: enoyl-CoA hydratase/isomerase family protein [Oligoflexia bacterium]|nr:enoyl-CoA hydratase/isomerase family protein [Oligoflexia bacterium]